MNIEKKLAISNAIVAIVVVVIIVVAGVAVYFATQPSTISTTSSSTTTTSSTTGPTTTPTSSTSSTSSTTSTTSSSQFILNPTNSKVLVDDSWSLAPDALDPGYAFYEEDTTIFTNTYQELVEFNGSSGFTVVPVLASSWATSNSNRTYTFPLRSDITFSNGHVLNASSVWFSYVREIYMGQAVATANYYDLTFNSTFASLSANGGNYYPWGLRAAIQSVTGLQTTTDNGLAVRAVNQLLSNFNAKNQTIQAIMAYQNQAYVAPAGTNTFTINLLNPYNFLLSDIAVWWGAVVDPTFVDAHGGVANNTVNSYYNSNGGPGSGPYELQSVGASFSTAVLQANPNYWGTGRNDLPKVAQPAQIPTIELNYGLPQVDVEQAFGSNQAQIGGGVLFYSPPINGQPDPYYQVYKYSQYYGYNQIFDNAGFAIYQTFLSLNTQRFPTNNPDFRLALVHAVNYSQILNAIYYYNGTYFGATYLGPGLPQLPYYNPDNLPPYQFNINLAAHYLDLAGKQDNFNVQMPNGTLLGAPKGTLLGPLQIQYTAPLSAASLLELELISNDLSQIGLAVSPQAVTPAVRTTQHTPQTAPLIDDGGWIPDWPDAIYQMIGPELTTTAGLPEWMNDTYINNLMNTLPFANSATQLAGMRALYNYTYGIAPYVWLVQPSNLFYKQPYLQNMNFNEFVGQYYNLMYYQPVPGDK